MSDTSKRKLYSDEVVEDSEPERLAKRQKTREQARARKMNYSRLHLQRADQPDQELTNTEPNIYGPISVIVRAQSQVDKPVSVTSCSSQTKLPPSTELDRMDHIVTDTPRPSSIALDQRGHRSNINAIDTTPEPYNAPGINCTHPAPPYIAAPEALLPSDSEDEPRLKLSRFAFQAISKTEVNRPGVLPRSGSTVAPEIPPESSSAPKARLKRAIVHRFSNDFSDTQFASLTNCVSCNLKWTSKKTASQKVIHIQNCAKKKFLSDDTVRTLVYKEIGSSSDQNPPDETGKKTAEEGEKSTTVLETIINEISQTKKSRRPQVLGTVKSLPETRSTILEKARAILDASMQHRDSAVWAPMSNRVQAATNEVPCTQAFGTSMLARRADSYPREQLGPPQTQAFGKSTLGHLKPHAQTSGL